MKCEKKKPELVDFSLFLFLCKTSTLLVAFGNEHLKVFLESVLLSQFVLPLNCFQISCAAVAHPIKVKIVADVIGSYKSFIGSYKSFIGSYKSSIGSYL